MGCSKNRQIWLFHRDLRSTDLLLVNICRFYDMGVRLFQLPLLAPAKLNMAFLLIIWWDASVFSQKQDMGSHMERKGKKQSATFALRFAPSLVSSLTYCWFVCLQGSGEVKQHGLEKPNSRQSFFLAF